MPKVMTASAPPSRLRDGGDSDPPEPSRAPVDETAQRRAVQAGSLELARFLKRNGEAFAEARTASEDAAELGEGPLDAEGFTAAWMEDFDRRAEESLNAMMPEVRALFGTDFEALRAESFADADGFERDRRILAIQARIGQAREDYVQLVGQEPETFDAAVALMEEMIRGSSLRPDLIESELAEARQALFESCRQARMASANPEARDPDRFLTELEAGRFDGFVLPEEKDGLLSRTKTEVAQHLRDLETLRKVDIDARVRREVEAVFSGEDDALGALDEESLREEEVLEAFPGERGEALTRRLRQARSAKAAWKKVATAQAFELQEMTAALRESAGEDSDEFRGFMQAVAERDRRLRDDPKRYVLDHMPVVQQAEAAAAEVAAKAANVTGMPAKQAALMQEASRLKQRAVRISLRMQELLMGNPQGLRVLGRQEAADLARDLGALPPEQQLARFTGLDRDYGPYAERLLNELMASGLTQDQGGTALLVFSGAPAELQRAWLSAQGKTLGGLIETVGEQEANALIEGLLAATREVSTAMTAIGRRRERGARLDMALRLLLQMRLASRGGEAEPLVQAVVDSFFPFQRVAPQVLAPKELLGQVTADDVAAYLEERLARYEDIDAQQTPPTAFQFKGVDPKVLERMRDGARFTEESAARLKEGRSWRSTADGVRLVDATGQLAVRNDGRFVTLSWREILGAITGETFPVLSRGLRG